MLRNAQNPITPSIFSTVQMPSFSPLQIPWFSTNRNQKNSEYCMTYSKTIEINNTLPTISAVEISCYSLPSFKKKLVSITSLIIFVILLKMQINIFRGLYGNNRQSTQHVF